MSEYNPIIPTIHDSMEEDVSMIQNVYKEIQKKNTNEADNISLLIFEDDTFRPILFPALAPKFMNILEKWYIDCKLIFDIEETQYSCSKDVFYQLFPNIFTDYPISKKVDFINTYIPLLIANHKLSCIADKYKSLYNDDYRIHTPDRSAPLPDKTEKIIHKLDIKIPEKLLCNGIPKKDSQGIPKVEFPTFHSPDNVKSYNFYNAGLSSNLVSNLDTIFQKQSDPSDNTCHIYIILHTKSLHTKVVKNPTEEEMKIIREYPEFGFVKILNIYTANEDFIKYVDLTFEKTQFESIAKLNEALSTTSQYLVLCESQYKTNIAHKSEEKAVKDFLNYTYIITENIDDKIKASTLCEIIVKLFNTNTTENLENIKSFRIRLSSYLYNIGLKKKRFNDGFYYYGLRKRADLCFEDLFINAHNIHNT